MKKITFLMFIVLAACTARATQVPNPVPEIQMNPEELNTKIILSESLGMKGIFDATGVISLDLKNISDGVVSFPSDFGSEIYVRNGTEWEKVNNIFGYAAGDNVLPTTKEHPPGLVVLVKPDLTNVSLRPIILRITVTGVLNDSSNNVGAYLDVTIE